MYAALKAFVPNRALDDDASVMINYESGAHAVLTASQICIGKSNALTIRVHCELGSIEWNQENPDALVVTKLNANPTIYTRGGPDLHQDAELSSRIPAGHPEGYLEAFANIYRGVADHIHALHNDTEPSRLAQLIPTMSVGKQGVRFVEACVESSNSNSVVSL